MKRITVKKYMTQPASPEFDFMTKWNNNNPMPLRTMVGTIEKQTRGMVYMKLHGDIYAEKIHTCMKCGRPLTNPVSQYFGIGPECGNHGYVNPFNSQEELNAAVASYRKELQSIKWEGWIIRSAIVDEEDLDGSDENLPEIAERREEKKSAKIRIADSCKCFDPTSLFISSPYDENLIRVIRALPDRYWHSDKKEWEVPAKHFDEIKAAMTAYDIVIEGKLPEQDKFDINVDFEFKTKPFEHQLVSFEYALTHDRWLLGDEMGLGKTKQAIDIAVYKKQTKGYKHCLIVCGVNGLKWNWVNEVKTHSNEGAHILGQRSVNGKIKIGSTADKVDDLKMLSKTPNNKGLDIDEYFIITNVETLRDKEIQANLTALCKSGIIEMIIVDEIHKMKNPSSQQGKGLLKLSAPTMIAMTGTPLMNNPMDLYIILKWLGYEKHAFYSFKNHYCVMGGYGGYEIVGYRNLEQLQGQLNSIMLRRRKEDVLNLPEKTYIDEYVDLTPKQLQIYREVTADIKSNIDQIKISPNPLASLIRLRQATGYTGILSSTVKESAKLDRMEELVDDAIANDRKVVIFSNWTQMTTPIYNRLAKRYKGTYITGETPDAERQARVIAFQNNENCRFIVGTAGAMGTGLTLTAGTVEIFLDEPWNMALKEQCVDRCHRIGQKSNLTIYTIMAKGTIDERIHDIVTQKGVMADAIVDGKIINHKEELLDFLLS